MPRSVLALVVLCDSLASGLFVLNGASPDSALSTEDTVMVGETTSTMPIQEQGRQLGVSMGTVELRPNELLMYGAIAIGVATVLAGLTVGGLRYYADQCTDNYHGTAAPGPVWAGDDSIQVLVNGNGQDAELDIRADGFDSYEMLRELVVDALPGMFDDSDEIVLDYLDERSHWVRVKTRTPLEALKASGSVKISCRASKKSRRQTEPARKKKSRP